MYQKEKNEVIKAGITLDRYELIALSGGNISMRIGDQVLVTPSGMIYEDMVEDDVLVVDLDGNLHTNAELYQNKLTLIYYWESWCPFSKDFNTC